MTTTTAAGGTAAESTARNVEKLANSNITEEQFFRRFLHELSEAAGARAAAVWLIDSQGLLTLFSETGLADLGLGQDVAGNRQHVQQLLEVVKSEQAALFAPDGTKATEGRSAHVLLVSPLQAPEQTVGVVELFLPADSPADQRLDHLQFLEEMTAYASRYLQWRQHAGSPDNHLTFWNDFEQFLGALYGSLNSAEVAGTAVNDGRRLLGCDRLSLAGRRGSRTDILAISGQDRVNARSNLVRFMRQAVDKVIASGQTLVYSGRFEDLPPLVEKPLSEFINASGSRMVKIIPLFERAQTAGAEDDLPNRAQQPRRATGALVVEQTSESWMTPVTSERSDLLAEHTARALSNCAAQERIFLLPLWRWMGRCLAFFEGRTLAITILVCLIVAAAGTLMTWTPARYRVEGTGLLMPVNQRDVFAPWDGSVTEIYAQSGQQVIAGQPLLKLRNDELNAQLLALRNRLNEQQQVLNSLKAEVDEANRIGRRDAEIRSRGQLMKVRMELGGLKERIVALEAQVERLTVRSPIDGTVATFQLDQLLRNRPVRRGELLLQVMDEQHAWQLELEIPEHRLGHLLKAQQTTTSDELPVEFVLATRPEETFTGRLAGLSTRSGVSEEHGTAVDARVALDASTLPNRRIGAEVEAKITCGQKSLFYVLFGDVVEFVQRRWW